MADQTYNFTLQVTDALGRVATLDDSIVVRDAIVAPESVVLQDRTIRVRADTTQGVNRTTATTITLASTGRLSTSDGFVSATEWGVDVTAADWEVRATAIGGATFSGSPVGVWISLADSPSWTEEFTANCANGLPAAQITSMTLEIRDVATETVAASATSTHDHLISPIAASVRLTDGEYGMSALSLGLAPAEAAVTLYFRNDGVLQIFRANNAAPATAFEPPNEWGRSLAASNYEVKFDIVVDDPQVIFDAYPVFGTWGNLGVSCSAQALLRNESSGVITGECVIRATVRPVGGAPVATADYTISLEAERYPGGVIP